MKIIRWILGNLILFFDELFSPSAIERKLEDQKRIDAETQSLVIYQLHSCPFCVKVRRAMKRLNLSIPLKNVDTDSAAFDEMMAGGKIDQVPCLKITGNEGSVKWMYESVAINQYLEQRFS